MLTGTNATFIFDGDSLSAWPGSFAWLFRDMSFAANRKAYYNLAVGGQVIAQVVDRYEPMVYPHRPDTHGGDGGDAAFYHILVGTNVFNLNTASTSSDLIDPLAALVSRAKSDGFIVIVGTLTPFGDALSSGSIVKRLQSNAAIRRNTIGADLIPDYASVLPNAFDADIYPDKHHPGPPGRYLMAKYLNEGLTRGYFDNKSFVRVEPWNRNDIEREWQLTAGGLYVPYLDVFREMKISGQIYPQEMHGSQLIPACEIAMRYSSTNGVANDWIGSGYKAQFLHHVGNAVTAQPSTPDHIPLSAGKLATPSAENCINFEITISNWNKPTYTKAKVRVDYFDQATQMIAESHGTVWHTGNTQMNAFQMYSVLGDQTFSGYVRLEGIKG
ncbi:SGNH/GDSL hydrolase family protein [Rhizobium sp. HT1-10]|uniref:SGNH/GDSL hydrolase family protein n=1 Tax=Rhizobium sp. HT1-10 TaxID=3111638 RepID=UPI003C2809ED